MSGARRWTLLTVCFSVFVISMDTMILNVALPTLVRSLDASTAELQWIVDGYVVVFAGLLLSAGSLGDRFGRANALRLGLGAFGAASAVASSSTSATALIACRAVMGIGAAFILPASLSILSQAFPRPAERARAIGTWSAVVGLGFGLGPLIGGLLLERYWWGAIFLVNVPIVLGLLIVSIRTVPDSRDPSRPAVDLLGVVLSTVGISALVWATIQAPDHGWLSCRPHSVWVRPRPS
jgi:MFS family permease